MNISRIRCLSFDCYGTLIDWEAGLLGALRPLLEHHGVQASDSRLLEAFAEAESAAEAGPYRSYKENLREVLRTLGVERDEMLHVAQSLYHDIGPAGRLGISTVWVNRRQGQSGSGATPVATARPDLELPDLTTLVELMNER